MPPCIRPSKAAATGPARFRWWPQQTWTTRPRWPRRSPRHRLPRGSRLLVPGNQVIKDRRQPAKFVEVGSGKLAQPLFAFGGKPDADNAAVAVVPRALDQARGHRPVDQLDRAVVPEQQVISQLANGGRIAAGMALDRQQQLVLCRGEPGAARLGLAPMQELAQAGAEFQQVLVVHGGWLAVVGHGTATRSDHDERHIRELQLPSFSLSIAANRRTSGFRQFRTGSTNVVLIKYLRRWPHAELFVRAVGRPAAG